MEYTILVRENPQVPIPVENWEEQILMRYSPTKAKKALELLEIIKKEPKPRDDLAELVNMGRSTIWDMFFENHPNLFGLGLVLVLIPRKAIRGRPKKYYCFNNKEARSKGINYIKQLLFT
jgi:hypothetical protein